MNLKTLSKYLPITGIPCGPCGANINQMWFDMDNYDNYTRSGGHPRYNETDISYVSNSDGYRCTSFGEAHGIRLISIGCSWVFGLGVPQSVIFHERFAERLRYELGAPVINWNLGFSGASNDYISRVLHLAIPVLKPHIVIVLFTYISRRKYVSVDGRRVNYSIHAKISDPIAKDIHTHFTALSSEYDDQLHFFRNYKSIESLLTGRPWLFSSVKPGDLDTLTAHLDLCRKAKPHNGLLDKARDHVHPGPETHNLLYRLFWDRFIDAYGVESLRKGS